VPVSLPSGRIFYRNHLARKRQVGEGVSPTLDAIQNVAVFDVDVEHTLALVVFQFEVSEADRLAYMYYLGEGVTQNHAEAVKWHRRAADQGLAVAQDSLRSMYEHGDGAPQDYAEALRWYRLAVDQGIVFAQYNLGAV
jgi:TPR repeat protein